MAEPFEYIPIIAIILFAMLCCCINGCRCDDEYRPSRKTFRRMGTVGAGYGIGRSMFRNR